jgi:hypothetical protein
MKSNIYELFKSAPTDKAAIAKVLEAEDGQATVVDLGGTPCPVAGHLNQVIWGRTWISPWFIIKNSKNKPLILRLEPPFRP